MARKTLTQDASKQEKMNAHLMIFLTVLIDMIGFGIVIPILPLYSEHFHATDWQIGLLLGVYSLMQLICAPWLGRLSDKHGRRPILTISIMGTALGFLVLGLANSLPLLFLGRILDGISGGNISTAQAYIADITVPEKRAGVMGMIGAAFGLGFMIGPALGGWLGHFSMALPFLVAAGLAFTNAVAVYWLLPESLPEENRERAPMETPWQTLLSARNTSLGPILLCSLLATIAFSLVTAHYTLFTNHRLGWHAIENGNMYAFIGFLGVLIQGGLIRRLAPRTGEKPLVILGAAVLCLSMFVLPLNTALPMIIGASAGLAIGNSLMTPMLNALASKSADSQSQGTVMGLMQAIASLGRMLGPVLGGFLLHYDAVHTHRLYGITPFWASAAVMALAVVAAWRLAAGLRPVHLQENPS